MKKEDITMLFILALLLIGLVLGIAMGLLITMDYYCEPKDDDIDEKCEEAGYIPPRNYYQLSQ